LPERLGSDDLELVLERIGVGDGRQRGAGHVDHAGHAAGGRGSGAAGEILTMGETWIVEVNVAVNGAGKNEGAVEVDPVLVAGGGFGVGGQDLLETPVLDDELDGIGVVSLGRDAEVDVTGSHGGNSLTRSVSIPGARVSFASTLERSIAIAITIGIGIERSKHRVFHR